jgi:hypothetical protein
MFRPATAALYVGIIPGRQYATGPVTRLLTRPQNGVDNDLVPIKWFAREYERTCANCGYSWRVPRSIARRGIPRMSGWRVSGGAFPGGFGRPGGPGFAEARSDISSRAEQAEQMEGFRICAKCGVDKFTQRPVRG